MASSKFAASLASTPTVSRRSSQESVVTTLRSIPSLESIEEEGSDTESLLLHSPEELHQELPEVFSAAPSSHGADDDYVVDSKPNVFQNILRKYPSASRLLESLATSLPYNLFPQAPQALTPPAVLVPHRDNFVVEVEVDASSKVENEVVLTRINASAAPPTYQHFVMYHERETRQFEVRHTPVSDLYNNDTLYNAYSSLSQSSPITVQHSTVPPLPPLVYLGEEIYEPIDQRGYLRLLLDFYNDPENQ